MRFAAGIALALLAALPCAGQDWPSRPLRIVVSLPAGNHPDAVARVLAQELGARLRQSVVVENRPGAQTNIGMESVARAAPDGYTLLLALTGLAINAHLQPLSFDPQRDFAPVAPLSRIQFVLLAAQSLPVSTLRDLVAYARERPGAVTCAHGGGSTQLGCALFAALARANIVQAPYRGNTLIIGDLARGEVHMMFENLGLAAHNMRVAHSKALAVTDPALGSEPLGRLPSVAEALPGFELTSWQAIVAPAGTPPAIVRRLNAEISAALDAPALAQVLAQGGAQPMRQSPEEFGEFLRAEHARYARIVRAAGL